MFTALMIIKIIVLIWSLIFMICLYRTVKKVLYKTPLLWYEANNKEQNFKFKFGSKEIEINYRSE
nr:MAG TPA: hypothetical protein [Caudoviricetes sp.]